MSGPDNGEHSAPNRRAFLKATGTFAVAGSVAGCIGGGDGGDGGDGGGGGGDGGDGGSGSDGGDGGSGADGDGGSTGGPADDYPSDDITFIVPYSTGGGFDAYARLMAPYLEDELGTTVNVQNVTGGGGVNGATQVWNAEPDGHTILIWSPKEAAYKQIGLDVDFTIQEYTHIGYVTQDPNEVTLKEELGIDTWDQFVDAIPDLNFVTQGRGSSAHMLTVLLGGMTGAFDPESVNFVHYGGTGAALGGLESGEGDAFTVGTASSAVKVVNSLDMEMFLMFSSPDHSIAEYLEANDVEVENWSTELDIDNIEQYNDLTVFRRFITGPPDVPEEIQQRQVEAFDAILNNEEFTEEAWDAARPVINPAAGEEPVNEAIELTFDNLDQEPYRGMIQDAFSG